MWEAYTKEFFFFLERCLWKELNHNFFYYVLDIWMDLISDLVTNGLARLNLPLELSFLCIGLCQIILVLWFFMHYVHENVVVGIDLWWFPYIIPKIVIYLDFLRHCFQFCCRTLVEVFLVQKKSVYSRFNFLWMQDCKDMYAVLFSIRRTTCCQTAIMKLPHAWLSALGRGGNHKFKSFHSTGLSSQEKFSSQLPKQP